jgi:hypothetical protein
MTMTFCAFEGGFEAHAAVGFTESVFFQPRLHIAQGNRDKCGEHGRLI